MTSEPGVVPAARALSAELTIAVVAGEGSGDQLGAKLMQALVREAARPITFVGVGGSLMAAEGLTSVFPVSDIAVMGLVSVFRRLPAILRRIREAGDAVVAAQPDLLIVIDSPDFTHRVAKRVRARRPGLPIVDYVSPSVWAWRPGRARKMRTYVDHLMALLPFEPAAHRRLGGPPCTYVGHPLVERLDDLRPNHAEQVRRAAAPPTVVVLPGSRRAEVAHHCEVFGAALGLVVQRLGPLELVLPAVDHLADDIASRVASWPIAPRIVRGEAAKLAAFREARVALAVSGTVTLELALAQVPTVVAYKVSPWESWIRYVVNVPSIVLSNLVLGANAVPEFIQEAATPERLADALGTLLQDGPIRQAQLDALATLDGLMRLDGAEPPSRRAARICLDLLGIEPVVNQRAPV